MTKHNKEVKKRADKVKRILCEHYDQDDIETSAMDMLADLLHLCNFHDYHFDDLLYRAREHEHCERLGIE